jgi:hypothetical protein
VRSTHEAEAEMGCTQLCITVATETPFSTPHTPSGHGGCAGAVVVLVVLWCDTWATSQLQNSSTPEA